MENLFDDFDLYVTCEEYYNNLYYTSADYEENDIDIEDYEEF